MDKVHTLQDRLAEFYRRLSAQPPSNNVDEAMARIIATLEQVEDEWSGIPRKDPPPPPGESDGRMYPPQEDHCERLADGTLVARAKKHTIVVSPDGTIAIWNRATELPGFVQAGGGKQ